MDFTRAIIHMGENGLTVPPDVDKSRRFPASHRRYADALLKALDINSWV